MKRLTGGVTAELLDCVFTEWNLTASTAKSKLLIVGRDSHAQAAHLNIILRSDRPDVVSKFKCLGSIITSDNSITDLPVLAMHGTS